jgi:hypothetical protein
MLFDTTPRGSRARAHTHTHTHTKKQQRQDRMIVGLDPMGQTLESTRTCSTVSVPKNFMSGK